MPENDKLTAEIIDAIEEAGWTQDKLESSKHALVFYRASTDPDFSEDWLTIMMKVDKT